MRDRVSIDLRGLGPQFRELADREQTTTAALARRGVLLMLKDQAGEASQAVVRPAHARDSKRVKITLRMSSVYATALAARARGADIAQGAYVCTLLDGVAPPLLPVDHVLAVRTLVASTDRLAAVSTDINACLRLLRSSSTTDWQRCSSGRLTALSETVREHLASASALMNELRPFRRHG